MGANGFRRRNEHELAQLSEDELIAYLVAARKAGDRDASGLAVSMLVWGRMDWVRIRVAAKTPTDKVDEVAEAAMHAAILGALKGGFDGTSAGEFVNWLKTITARRIADFHRDPKRDVRLVPLLSRDDDEEGRGVEPAVEFEGDTVDVQRAIETALSELSPEHREVVNLYIFDDLPGPEVSDRTGQSEANIHQIARRFRKRIDELLSPDSDT